VKIWSVLPRLLSILAIAGLLSAPVATPLAAVTFADAPMADMASITDGMPCCPHQEPSIPDCQKNCPFAALCTAQCIPAVAAEAAFLIRKLAQAKPLSLYNEMLRDQRYVATPQRPPRV
jgi:hypothetical protein